MPGSMNELACGCASCRASAVDRSEERPSLRVFEVMPTGSSGHETADPTGDAHVDSLISGSRWESDDAGGLTIQYSFASEGSTWRAGYGNDEPGFWAGDFSAAEKAVIQKAMAAWSAVADIRFVEIAESSASAGDIRFGRSTLPSTAWAYLPDGSAEGGDIWLGEQRFPSVGEPEVVDWIYAPGSWRYFTLMHEIGHALGLLHPHDGDDGVGGILDPAADWIGASIMSYRSHPGQALGQGYGVEIYPTTPMGLDVAAMQALYGASTAFAGHTRWSWSEGERIYGTIWDSGGIDTVDWSNQSSEATIRLGQGNWSELGEPFRWSADGGGSLPGTLFIARGTLVENAFGGSAADRIEGNALGNRIEGNAGNDLLSGGDGRDSLFGGAGDDRIEGGTDDDLVSGQHGQDMILGGLGDDSLYGFADDDRIFGEDGEDYLFGGDGADRLYGAVGADRLDGGAAGDFLYGGTGDNHMAGGAGDDALFGGGGADRLLGGPGDDLLNGGSGADILDGGAGDDLIVAWYGSDMIAGGAGTDTLQVGFAASDYRIDGTAADGSLVDTAARDGNLGLDRFTSIERIDFLDRTLGWTGSRWEVIA